MTGFINTISQDYALKYTWSAFFGLLISIVLSLIFNFEMTQSISIFFGAGLLSINLLNEKKLSTDKNNLNTLNEAHQEYISKLELSQKNELLEVHNHYGLILCQEISQLLKKLYTGDKISIRLSSLEDILIKCVDCCPNSKLNEQFDNAFSSCNSFRNAIELKKLDPKIPVDYSKLLVWIQETEKHLKALRTN